MIINSIRIRLGRQSAAALAACSLAFLAGAAPLRSAGEQPWSPEKANAWYAHHDWLVGANFVPSSAVNQLEMWQADTFDPERIDRELGWAHDIGFNTVRVFLHHLAWAQDPAGFLGRMDRFLAIAHRHGIQPLFVFFDDCWIATPQPGRQPAPKPGVHNSGWVQDPGDPAYRETKNFPQLRDYVTAVVSRFAHDDRVLLWDLYNEPGNSGKREASLPLLRAVFQWARAAHPEQPVTAGIWNAEFETLNAFQAENSDIITYHNYLPLPAHLAEVRYLRVTGRPLICTEYMARPRDSRFSTILPMLKREHVGAINWGFVAGKTNTMYAWDTPLPDGSEPAEWFHDIFRADGTPYRQDEVALIRQLTARGR